MDERITLQNGIGIPKIGFGTWKIPDGEVVEEAVLSALEAGYRLIDTATIYGNESGVGSAIEKSAISRGKLFITTKLWNEDQGFDETQAAFAKSLRVLQLEYLDLYLMHWPVTGKRLESWRAMEELYKSGQVKSIGVSNFTVRHLEELLQHANVVPAVNQVELHPFLFDQQKELLEFCRAHGIVVEAYSPLAHANRMNDKTVGELAEKYGKSNAQILLRWAVQRGTIPIPKSTNRIRMKENIEIFDFSIDDADMNKLNNLGDNFRTCGDPNGME